MAPGWIATPLTQALQDDPARRPLGRWGTPAASVMTGVVLPVDGGYLVS